MTTFQQYASAGFLGEVIPIIPPGVAVTRDSKLDETKLGKTPGLYRQDQRAWAGMTEWTTRVFTESDILTWDRWEKASIGLRAALFPAVDQDCSHAYVNDAVAALARKVLGDGLQRTRSNSNRWLMAYKLAEGSESVTKIRVVYRFPGDDPNETPPATEILGRGQQYVVEGLHPSGVPIEWKGGSPAMWGADGMIEITKAQVLDFVTQLKALIVQLGGMLVHTTETGQSGARKPIGDPRLLASDMKLLGKAVDAMPNNLDDYDEWIKLIAAIKAACGGSAEFYVEHFEPWALRYPGNTPEVVRGKWDSIHDAVLGADYVYGTAREHGFEGEENFIAYDGSASVSDVDRQAKRAHAPKLKLVGRYLDTHTEEAERILAEAQLGIFSYGDRLVHPEMVDIPASDGRVTQGLRLVPVKPQYLRAKLTQAICFLKYDARFKAWKETNCPPDLPQVILEKGAWRFPSIRGFTNCPVFLRDGTILSKAGYDKESKLYFVDDGTRFPEVPDRPTREDALKALAELKEPIREMPYTSEIDRAGALSGMLSGVARYAVRNTPMHAVTACGSRQGKSKHADIAAMITEGRAASATPPGSAEHELEKQVATCLRYGDAVISLDNVVEPIGRSALINSCLTQEEINIRVFGKLERDKVPGNRMVFANGNNLVLESDLVNRAILIQLDCPMEHPEERSFDWDPVEVIASNRGKYVAAALTVLRAYHVAGRPSMGLRPMGGFEDWSELVRGALVWLGEADPRNNMSQLRANDPERSGLSQVIGAWQAEFGLKPVAARTLLEGSDGQPTDRPLRYAIEGALISDRPTALQLGKWLQRMTGKVSGNLRIVRGGEDAHAKINFWRLEPAGGAGKSG